MFRRLRRSQLALSHDRILARQLKRRLWPLRPPPATQTRPFTAIPHHQGGAKRHYEPWRREEGPPKRSPVAEPTIYASPSGQFKSKKISIFDHSLLPMIRWRVNSSVRGRLSSREDAEICAGCPYETLKHSTKEVFDIIAAIP